MRVFLISLGTVLVLAMGLFMSRMWGLSQQYPPLDHVLLQAKSEPIVIVQAESVSEIEKIQNKSAQAWIWLNVRTTADSQILVSNSKENFRKIDSALWTKDHPDSMTLAQAYSQFPKTVFVLNIMETAPETHLLVIEQTKDHHADERTIVQSDTLSIVKALKDLKPQWLFGTSRSDLLQLLTMSSIGAAPIAQMSGDVFIASLTTLNRPSFDEAVLQEVKRRNKWRLLGPLNSVLQVNEAKRWAPDGYIFANLEVFLNY